MKDRKVDITTYFNKVNTHSPLFNYNATYIFNFLTFFFIFKIFSASFAEK